MIAEGSTVAIEYKLTLDDGSVADSNVGQDPLTFTYGGGQMLPAFEAALLGKAPGATVSFALTAENGYGVVNTEAFQEVDLGLIPEDARVVGSLLVATDPNGRQQRLRVHEVRESTVVLDFNHPLAGQALNFEVRVLSVD